MGKQGKYRNLCISEKGILVLIFIRNLFQQCRRIVTFKIIFAYRGFIVCSKVIKALTIT